MYHRRRLRHRHEVATVVLVHGRDRVAHLALHPVEARVHAAKLVLEPEDVLDAGEVEPELARQPLDQTQPLEVRLRVQPRVAGSALRAHEPLLLVDAQRLRVHPDEVGRDRDHVPGVVVDHPATFWNSSSSSRPRLFSFFGTSIFTRASRSPLPPPFSFGAPRPLIFSSLPSSEPAGILRATWPSGVGTSTRPPSAAVGKLTGTSTSRSAAPPRW